MDSPGIFDMRRKFQSECTHCISYLLDFECSRTFHAVCYVIKIDRFTEEDLNVFERLKILLGQNVTRHMIVIITHGDSFGQGDIEQIISNAPERLKEVLDECGNRYVVFDNTATKEKSQVDRFLNVLRRMNRDSTGKTKLYCSPGNAQIVRRWEDARNTENALRQNRFLIAG